MSEYHDIELENQAFNSVSDTLFRNRMLKEQKAEREAQQQRLAQNAEATAAYRTADLGEKTRHDTEDEKIKQAALDEQMRKQGDTEKAEADKGKPKFSWTTKDGTTVTAVGADQIAPLAKQYPSVAKNGKHSMTMKALDPTTGVETSQTIDMPEEADPKATDYVKNAVINFAKMTGAGPKPPTNPDPGHENAERNRLLADTIIKQDPGNQSPTNAPYAMQQFDALSKPVAAPAPAAAPAAQPAARVKVRDKAGKMFTVPQEQLDEAKAQGYIPMTQ